MSADRAAVSVSCSTSVSGEPHNHSESRWAYTPGTWVCRRPHQPRGGKTPSFPASAAFRAGSSCAGRVDCRSQVCDVIVAVVDVSAGPRRLGIDRSFVHPPPPYRGEMPSDLADVHVERTSTPTPVPQDRRQHLDRAGWSATTEKPVCGCVDQPRQPLTVGGRPGNRLCSTSGAPHEATIWPRPGGRPWLLMRPFESGGQLARLVGL